MADEGASFYYVSKQDFDFWQVYNYLENLGLSMKNPNTQKIIGIESGNEMEEEDPENIKKMIDDGISFGINLWSDCGSASFWTIGEIEDCFCQNFGFSSFRDPTVEKVSKILIKYAVQELNTLDKKFLGFSLDRYGRTEHHEYFEEFITKNQEKINSRNVPDLLFFPKHKMNQIIWDDELKQIEINQNFNCIEHDSDLYDFTKDLLSKG